MSVSFLQQDSVRLVTHQSNLVGEAVVRERLQDSTSFLLTARFAVGFSNQGCFEGNIPRVERSKSVNSSREALLLLKGSSQ